jgi:hypothetical protein
MAFYDDPIVDLSSERSEESILKTQLILSRKSGFICHEIDGNKDYGVDINCQLVNQSRATGFAFPIQVKSKASIKIKDVDGTSFIRISFKTSRLGHLMRHPPSYGLIIIYDDQSGELFFDYTIDIYNRLRIEKGADDWKQKEEVTISIPTANKLDTKHIGEIHDRFIQLFINAEKMTLDHGEAYDIPMPESSTESSSMSSLEILEKYGEVLFNSHKLREITHLIGRLNRAALNNKIVTFLGAITYTEVGNLIEADYFFRLCEKYKSEYSSKQQEVLNFQNFKREFYKGILSKDELTTKLNEIKNQSTTNENSIYAEINLINIELLKKIGEKDFDESIFDLIDRLFTRIESQINNHDTRHLQLVFLAEILSRSIGRVLSDMAIDTRIYQTAGLNPATKTRIYKTQKLINLNSKCHKIYLEAIKYAEETQNDLILSHSHLNISLLYFEKCFAFFLADHYPEDNQEDILSEILNSSVLAYNKLMGLGLEPFAFNALILSAEIHHLANRWLNINLDKVVKLSTINEKIVWLQNNGFSKPFRSVVEDAYGRKTVVMNMKESAVAELTTDEIETIARVQMRSLGLPKNRYDNLITDIKASSIFYARCKNKDLVLASDQNKQNSDAYTDKPKFRVSSRKTNLVYAEGYDIEKILNQLGY